MHLFSAPRMATLALPLAANLVSGASIDTYPWSLSNVIVGRNTPSFEVQGCFREPPSHEGRALKAKSTSSDTMTTETCAEFCVDYQYFGTEYGRECFCGNVIAPNTNSAEGACNMACTGDASQVCGAGDHLNIYTNGAYIAPSIAAVDGYVYKGCRAEPEHHRDLPDKLYAQDDMTPQVCADLCSADGFLYAGLEYGRECFCGNTFHGGKWVDDSECTKLCAGDKTRFCGNGQRLSVYGPESVVVAEVPNYEHVGCVVDSPSARVLSAYSTGSEDMTAQLCSSICGDYAYFGVEFGKECYCGSDFSADTVAASDAECDTPCAGDGATICGSRDRMNVYSATSVASNAETVEAFSFLHCGADEVSNRVLKGAYSGVPEITIEKCAGLCVDFTYFGLEFGKECFCGNEYSGIEKPIEECHMKCSGDSSQLCGGKDRIAIYSSAPATPSSTPSPTTSPSPSSSTTSSASTSSSSSTSSPTPTPTPTPSSISSSSSSSSPSPSPSPEPAPAPAPAPVTLCGRPGYCSLSTAGAQVAGNYATELACRNAVADAALTRNYQAYYWSGALCWGFINRISSPQCRFVYSANMAGAHGDLVCAV